MHHSNKLLQENIKPCQFLAIKGTRKASPKIIILAWRKFGRFITSSKHSREPLCEVVTARINCVSCLESITTMQYYSEINQDKIVIKTSFSRLTEGINWFSIVVYRCWLRFIIKNKLPNSVPVEKFSKKRNAVPGNKEILTGTSFLHLMARACYYKTNSISNIPYIVSYMLQSTREFCHRQVISPPKDFTQCIQHCNKKNILQCCKSHRWRVFTK